MDIARLVERREGPVYSCSADDTVHEAARLLAENRIGALPVLEGDRVVGIFSERDLLYCIAEVGVEALGKTVGEVMTAPPLTVGGNTHAIEALELMTLRRVRHLPVVDGERMVGFVSIGDLVKLRLELVQAEAEAMRVYIQSA
jgi:CBS domain-containing protein